MASLFGKNKLREIANKLQTSELENEIDQLVYQLYGLTDEEINVVEA